MPSSHHLNLATWHTISAPCTHTQLALQEHAPTSSTDRRRPPARLTEQRAGHRLAMRVEAREDRPDRGTDHRIDLTRIEG